MSHTNNDQYLNESFDELVRSKGLIINRIIICYLYTTNLTLRIFVWLLNCLWSATKDYLYYSTII